MRNSARLFVRKPLHWLLFGVSMFVFAFAITLVPIAGNYLRTFLGGLWGAFAIALAYTQAGEDAISVRRSFALLGAALPALLLVCLLDVAIFAFVDVPVIRLIATDREFGVYALSRMQNGQPRPIVDLVHTMVLTFASLPFAFAAPLMVLAACPFSTAVAKSWRAFALSWPVYVTFVLLSLVLPHALGGVIGAAGYAVFILVAIAMMPAGYLVFADAFE